MATEEPKVWEPEEWEAACQRGEVLGNGIIWKQLDFPCFQMIVLMAGSVNGVQMWCKVAFDRDNPPLIVATTESQWYFTGDDLLRWLHEHNFTVVGDGRIVDKGDSGHV
jgi:hypothetical protein